MTLSVLMVVTNKQQNGEEGHEFLYDLSEKSVY
jgi:hypothetical protein